MEEFSTFMDDFSNFMEDLSKFLEEQSKYVICPISWKICPISWKICPNSWKTSPNTYIWTALPWIWTNHGMSHPLLPQDVLKTMPCFVSCPLADCFSASLMNPLGTKSTGREPCWRHSKAKLILSRSNSPNTVLSRVFILGTIFTFGHLLAVFLAQIRQKMSIQSTYTQKFHTQLCTPELL